MTNIAYLCIVYHAKAFQSRNSRGGRIYERWSGWLSAWPSRVTRVTYVRLTMLTGVLYEKRGSARIECMLTSFEIAV
jgi:hypothetical protein